MTAKVYDRRSANESLVQRYINKTRRSHALEHATIHVLNQRMPALQLMGRSTASGFYLYGEVPTETVASAASEALSPLRSGQAGLAVHPRCGTNLAVGALLSGLTSLLVVSGSQRRRTSQFPQLVLGVTLALLASQPLGRLVQKEVTTLPDVEHVRIADIRQQRMGRTLVHHVQLDQG